MAQEKQLVWCLTSLKVIFCREPHLQLLGESVSKIKQVLLLKRDLLQGLLQLTKVCMNSAVDWDETVREELPQLLMDQKLTNTKVLPVLDSPIEMVVLDIDNPVHNCLLLTR